MNHSNNNNNDNNDNNNCTQSMLEVDDSSSSSNLDLDNNIKTIEPTPDLWLEPCIPTQQQELNQLTITAEHQVSLGVYAERAYLDYAMSVVKGRALPQVQDGLKPVQRRIIYAMQQMGLTAGAKPVKCARVVGDVLGKYHPHGDTAAYEALVRLAQSFTLRYPLIDGQGNFGSRDGDGAAAMRYTEARLTPVAQLLLNELEQGSVDFIHNYDGSQQEPSLLPARLPMLLLNGASGIAVGMATEMPPHNLTEVAQVALALLHDPDLDEAALMKILPGPDFPGGGQLISSKEEIANAYRVGRGSLRVRGRYALEELARGQWQLIFNELPHGVSAAQVLQDIEALTNPSIKTGKKTLTPEQTQLKTLFTSLLDAVRDESGKDAAVRLVFEPKSRSIDRDVLVNALLKHTCLESTVSLNLVCIGLDGKPRQIGLKAILQQWLAYRLETVRRRCQFHIHQLAQRIHVLEGRLLVLLSVDAVIKIIRSSDEPKPELINTFALTHRQADDILDLRLRQLAKLEGFKLEQELNQARKQVADLTALLAHEPALHKQVAQEIKLDAKTYGDARRTMIATAEKAAIALPQSDEPVTVMVSAKGWAKVRQGHGHDANTFTYKTGDQAWFVAECRSIDKLYAFSTTGRVYTVLLSDLPSARSDGVPWTTLMDAPPNTQWVLAMAANAATEVLCITRQGFALRANLLAMQATRKSGKQFINVDLEANDALAFVLPIATKPLINTGTGTGTGSGSDISIATGIDASPVASPMVLSLSNDGLALIQNANEIKYLAGGGKGVMLQKLAPNAQLAACCWVGSAGVLVQGITRQKPSEDSYTLRQLNAYLGKRASKGVALNTRVKTIERAIAVV